MTSGMPRRAGRWWQRLWRDFGRAGIGAMLVAVLSPLLLLSETRIKESIETAFGGCLFVIDLRRGPAADVVDVVGYMTGASPPQLNLTFQARRGLINRLEFRNGLLVRAPTPYSSLLLHPKAGQACPGELCLEPREIREPAPLMSIRLPNPSANFDYLFSMHLSDPPAAGRDLDESVAVYSIADQANVCRVEPANVFNVLVRLNKAERFAAYCIILLVLATLLIVFKKWGGRDAGQGH